MPRRTILVGSHANCSMSAAHPQTQEGGVAAAPAAPAAPGAGEGAPCCAPPECGRRLPGPC